MISPDEVNTNGNDRDDIQHSHPHSDDNMKDMKEQIQKFKNFCSTLLDLSKYPAFFGSFFGLLYLFSFTVTESIPFPLELSVLPTLLIAVGFIALFFVLIIVMGLLIPSMAQADTSNIEFLSLFVEVDEASQILKAKPLKERLTRYFFTFLLPTFFITLTSWTMFIWNNPMASIIPLLFVAIVFWAIYSAIHIWQNPTQIVSTDKPFFSKFGSLFFTFLHTNLLSWLSLGLFIIVAVIAFPEIFKGNNALANNYPISAFLVILLFFFILNFLSVIPFGRVGQLIISPKNNKLTIKLSMPIPIAPFILFILATIGSVIYPPTSHQMGGAALKVLGIGGGIIESLCFKSGQFPDALRELESSSQIDCTCGVSVIFDAGNTIYVKSNNTSTKVYAIKKDEISVQHHELSKKINKQ